MDRRQWLFGLLALVLFWTSPVAAQPTHDAVVVGMEAEPPGLDPGQALGLHTLRVTYQIFETLVTTPDGSTDVVPVSFAKTSSDSLGNIRDPGPRP
jgi:ABC-type oligopeptide transport system substrate-binding subunit